MTKSGIFKDERDTVKRRVRHRDGRLLRGGIGLTTGLGWSDRSVLLNAIRHPHLTSLQRGRRRAFSADQAPVQPHGREEKLVIITPSASPFALLQCRGVRRR